MTKAKVHKTTYRHVYNADGTKRFEPCSGLLEIHIEGANRFVVCAECGEGYRFHFVMKPQVGDGAAPNFNYANVPVPGQLRRK
jgi:hypothetical protein